MSDFSVDIFPQICEDNNFPHKKSNCRLLQSKLWHDRPKASVYRFEVADGDGKVRKYFFKQYKINKPISAVKEFTTLKELSALFGRNEELNVINPVTYIDGLNAFITEEFVGNDLHQYLKSSTTYYSAKRRFNNAKIAVNKLAEWFMIFQTKKSVEGEVGFDPNDILCSNLNKDFEDCIKAGLVGLGDIPLLTKKIDSYRKYFENRRYVPTAVNQDTKLWNFIINENGQLRGLDFVGFGYGPAMYDIARLWVGLNWIKIFPFNSSQKVGILQEILLKKFKNDNKFDKIEFNFFRLALALEVAAFYSKIGQDKYRRKFRNRALFIIIKKYFIRLLHEVVIEDDL